MKPVICNYYLTYRCNARCNFCNIWKEEKIPASQEASVDTVCKNLADARALGVKIVDFTGGEPLLYEGLQDVLSYAKNIGLRTTITTNCILYRDRASELAGLVDILQFSLDAADKQRHDAVKGVPSFDRVLESIESVRSIGEHPTFIHTVTDENISFVPDVLSLARKMKVPLYLNPCFSYFGNKGLSNKNARLLGRIARGKGVTIDRGFLKFFIEGGNKRDNPRCLAVSSVIVISPDDKLILPCFHFKGIEEPINGRLIDLRNSSLIEVEKKIDGRHPFCEGCTVYCYMRASLFRHLDRYFMLSVFSAAKYIFAYYLVCFLILL